METDQKQSMHDANREKGFRLQPHGVQVKSR
jgi:hypothetical protein